MGDLQSPSQPIRPGRCLLFEQSIDLGTGQRHRHQAVPKRLDRKGLAVGDIAIPFASTRRIGEVCADAARIHEGNDCSTKGRV